MTNNPRNGIQNQGVCLKFSTVEYEAKNRIRGCLLGVAIGDALGAPFEHLGPGQTTPLLNASEGLIKDFHPSPGAPSGAWTDDTGMTLATCRGLIKAEKSGGDILTAIRQAFADWAGGPECRKPGKTALRAAKIGRPDPHSWANGALMRIAPVGIYAYLKGCTPHEATSLAYDTARLTHGHPLATFPAVECALAILSILRWDEVVPSPSVHLEVLFERWRGDPLFRYEGYRKYRNAALCACHPSTGLRTWRQVFEFSLGMLEGDPWSRVPFFEAGMIRVLHESFDKDTSGAVAGAVLGAYWGESGLPKQWINGLVKSQEIVGIADEMVRLIKKSKQSQSVQIYDKEV